MVADARLTRNAVTGRFDLDGVREAYRSELIFTPLRGHLIDEPRLEACLDGWLAAGGVRPAGLFGGGALLTGLTAQRDNAAGLVRLIRRRLGSALVATADDPGLESWLAFMGACATLSRAHPEVPILHLDVGGGTTNLALGRAGEVRRTGCLFVGARHVQVEPGSYRIVHLSLYARAAFNHLGIGKDCGGDLTPGEIDRVLGFYQDLLEAAVSGTAGAFASPAARLHEQVGFHLPADAGEVAVTFSGGVGELIYAHLRGQPWPATTCYGDLGVDLARRIVRSPVLARSLNTFVPAAAGRATVYGLLRHTTEVSGATVFLPDPGRLPLADLPVFGDLSERSSDDQLRDALALVRASPRGGALRVQLGAAGAAGVRVLGPRLGRALRESAFPAELPLVLFVKENLGKALGHYVTGWRASAWNLMVIDEVPVRDAQYAHVGAPRGGVLPVSFYGLNP